MENQHDYAMIGKISAFCGRCWSVTNCYWRGNVSRKREGFSFRTRDSFFLQNNVYHLHQVRLLSALFLKKNNQNVTASFGLRIFVAASIVFFPGFDVDTVLAGILPASTLDISENVFN